MGDGDQCSSTWQVKQCWFWGWCQGSDLKPYSLKLKAMLTQGWGHAPKVKSTPPVKQFRRESSQGACRVIFNRGATRMPTSPSTNSTAAAVHLNHAAELGVSIVVAVRLSLVARVTFVAVASAACGRTDRSHVLTPLSAFRCPVRVSLRVVACLTCHLQLSQCVATLRDAPMQSGAHH